MSPFVLSNGMEAESGKPEITGQNGSCFIGNIRNASQAIKKQLNRKGFRIDVFVLTYPETKYYKSNNITKFMKTKKKFYSVG